MKKKLFLFVLMTIIFSAVRGQIVADFTFTAELNGVHKPLDSIYIGNITRGVDTMLYVNDTVLTVYSSIGVNDGIYQTSNELILYPNYPNPFSNSTTVWFYLPEDNSVLLKVFDITGREVAIHEQFLQRGHHCFRFNSGGESFYLLSVEAGDQRKVQKLINMSSVIGRAGIEYTEHNTDTYTYSRRMGGKSKSGFSWYPGDSMRFIGYVAISMSLIGHDVMEVNPYLSENYRFEIIVGIPCVDEPFVTDIDGNKYRTIQIGRQCWMRENLKVTKYADGSVIPIITDNLDWANLSTEALCWYDNDNVNNFHTYGALYNWYAFNNGSLCPVGWHVPEDIEWTIMTDYLGGANIAGGKLKEAGLNHWSTPNTGATNSNGFTALPGGYRNVGGDFISINQNGGWWTSTAYSQSNSMYSLMGHNYSTVHSFDGHNTFGFSVRCIRDSIILLPTVHTDSIASIASVSAISGGYISNDGGGKILARGVCWSNTPNPTLSDDNTIDGIGSGSFTSNLTGLYPSTTYYVRAYATNVSGTAYGQEIAFKTAVAPPCPGAPTVTDFNGNVYNTVQIGNQCWFKENLRVRNYNDGVPIGSDMAWYNNDTTAYDTIYGALYNWDAISTDKLCPVGWHVPNDTDWTNLTDYLGGENVAGGSLKDTGEIYWNHPNAFANNISGFTALPGGYRSYDGDFYTMGNNAYFWASATLIAPISQQYGRRLFNAHGHVLRDIIPDKNTYLSVRCMRNY